MFELLPLRHKLALLDPNAYEYVYSASWQRTVPQGATWYALNLWYVAINGVGDVFHRELHIAKAMVLPEGTTLTQGSRRGFAYICKPETIAVPPWPEMVYARRMHQLQTLAIHMVRAELPQGAPYSTFANATMPDDFADGLWRHVSTNDVAWTIVTCDPRSPTPDGAMNTLDEISDDHVIRLSGPLLCPFKRNQWDGIRVRSASNSGALHQPSVRHGVGVVSYNKLDSDWWR